MGKGTRKIRPRRPELESLEDRRLLNAPGTGPNGKPINDKDYVHLLIQLANNVPVADRRLSYTTAQGTHVVVTLYGFGSLAGSTLDGNGALNLVFSKTLANTRIIVTAEGGTGFAPLASVRAAGTTPNSPSAAGGVNVGIVNLRAMDLVPGGYINLAGGVGSLFLNSMGPNSQIHAVPLAPNVSTAPFTTANAQNGNPGNNLVVVTGTGGTAGTQAGAAAGAVGAATGASATAPVTTSGLISNGGGAGGGIVTATGLGSSAGGITNTTGLTSNGIAAGGGGGFAGGSAASAGSTGGLGAGGTSAGGFGLAPSTGASIGTGSNTGGAVGTSPGTTIRLMSTGVPAAQSTGTIVHTAQAGDATTPLTPSGPTTGTGTTTTPTTGTGTTTTPTTGTGTNTTGTGTNTSGTGTNTSGTGTTTTPTTGTTTPGTIANNSPAITTTPLTPGGTSNGATTVPPPIIGSALIPGGGNEFLFPVANNVVQPTQTPTGVTIAIKHINAGPLNGAPPLGHPQVFGVDPEAKVLVRFDGTTGAALQLIPLPTLTTATPSVGLGRDNGHLVALVGDGQTIMAFDALTGGSLGQFTTSNLAAIGFNGVDGIGSSDVGTLIVARQGPAVPIDVSASLATGMAVATGAPFFPQRELQLAGGATGLPGTDTLYAVGAAHFDAFQPDKLQFGIVTLSPAGHSYRESSRMALTSLGTGGTIPAGTSTMLNPSPFQGLGSIDSQLARLLGVVGGKNAVELINPSTLSESGLVALDDPDPLSGLSESFHPELVGAALVDVQGNILSFRAQDSHGLVLNDNGILNLVGINKAADSVIAGRPILHVNIPFRQNVQVVTDVRGPRGAATRGGVQVEPSLIQAPGPLSLPDSGPAAGNG